MGGPTGSAGACGRGAGRAIRPRALRASGVALALLALTATPACEPGAEPGGPLPVARVLGEFGTFPGQFGYPRAIASGPGHLWVIDKSARVQQIDPDTGRCLAWWQMPDFALGKPTGVTAAPATGPDGTLIDAVYVPDTHYHRVMVYAAPTLSGDVPAEVEPALLASFGSLGADPGQFVYPTDVAVLLIPDGSAVERIYVSEYGGTDRISVFGPDYEFLFSFGRLGDGLDPAQIEFSRPQSIAIDAARRELIVADSCNHRLGRFTLDGELLGWIGSPDPDLTGDVRLDFPYGIDILEDSTVLVTEFGACRVQRVDLERAESLGAFGRPGRGRGELATPWAAVVRGEETFILDSGNGRILVTELPGIEGGRS